MSYRRIIVVGTTGSGKTTLAGRISERLDIPHLELDAFNWGPDWTMRPNDVFRSAVERATLGEAWVIDGNYSRARDILWPRADTIVWLDYPFHVIMWRLWWRTLRRTLGKEELWSGNRERFWTQFTSKDSLFLWAFNTHWRWQREYPLLLNAPEHAHLTQIRLRSPRQTNKWLKEL